jgi:hypothetical protein
MDITDILIAAKKAVDDAKVPAELRTAAFEKAVEIISRDATSGRSPPGSSNTGRAAGAGEALVAKIARKLDLPADSIAEAYAESAEGGVDIVIGVGKLDSSTAGATKQLALLLSGGRQLGEVGEWTSSKAIRAVCIHYGRFDSANFAKTVREMDDSFSFRGRSHQLEVRPHQRGIEKLKNLLATLIGHGGSA